MENKDKKIAFFDSGVGGLTVFAKIKELLKGEDYIYFGDLKNSPYGEKTQEELIKISKKIFDYFQTQNVKAVVMACNTTSATAYDALKSDYDFKIYPIIQSCAKKIAQDNVKKLCVFATKATVNTHAYRNFIKKYNPNIDVVEIACPDWVQIIEENKISQNQDKIFSDLKRGLEYSPDKIILGCTHYPFLMNEFKKHIDTSKIINPADIFADFILSDLKKSYLIKNSLKGQEEFFVSDRVENFEHAASMFYKLKTSPKILSLK